MRILLLFPTFTALMACATPDARAGVDQDGGRIMMDGRGCDANNIADFIGQPATAELGADIQRRTGAHAFRWLLPNQVVTMEYRGDRVNVKLDSENRVEGVTCG